MVRECGGAAQREIRFDQNLKYVETGHGSGAKRLTIIGLVLLAAVSDALASIPLTPQAPELMMVSQT
jgi:hypothetical protein